MADLEAQTQTTTSGRREEDLKKMLVCRTHLGMLQSKNSTIIESSRKFKIYHDSTRKCVFFSSLLNFLFSAVIICRVFTLRNAEHRPQNEEVHPQEKSRRYSLDRHWKDLGKDRYRIESYCRYRKPKRYLDCFPKTLRFQSCYEIR